MWIRRPGDLRLLAQCCVFSKKATFLHLAVLHSSNEVFVHVYFHLDCSTLLTEKDPDNDFHKFTIKKSYTIILDYQNSDKFSLSVKKIFFVTVWPDTQWAFLGILHHFMTSSHSELGYMRLWFVYTKKKEHKHSWGTCAACATDYCWPTCRKTPVSMQNLFCLL
jgi:hypothetical protein